MANIFRGIKGVVKDRDMQYEKIHSFIEFASYLLCLEVCSEGSMYTCTACMQH